MKIKKNSMLAIIMAVVLIAGVTVVFATSNAKAGNSLQAG